MLSLRYLPFSCSGLRWVLLLCLLGAGWARADDEGPRVGEGEPFVQFWSPREYGGVTECPAITQDARGVIYVGNRGLVLEYDGSTWRQIALPGPGYVAGLAYDAGTDTVFVGTQVDLGCLKTQPGGAHTFVSLRDRLPEGERDVGDFFGVYASPQGIYFVGVDRVLRWREGRFDKTWKLTTTDSLRSHWAAGRLYISSREIGLLRLEGEEFVPASDDPLFRRAKVGAVLAEADGSLLVATIHDGMYTLREGVVRPLPCECDPFLKEHGIVKLLRLRDGSFAISTDAAELVLLDPARRFRSRVDRFGGGRGGEIYRLFEDAEGGLWVGLQTGVARAEPDSPLSILRARPDDDLSSTYAIAPWNGTVVVGNNSGVFRLAPADPAAAASAHFAWVPETAHSSYGMTAVSDGVLFMRGTQIMWLDAGGKATLAGEGLPEGDVLLASQVHPGLVYASDEGGHIYQLHRDAAADRWMSDGLVVELGPTGNVDLSESDGGDLWLGTSTHGVFRVALDPAGPPKVFSFFDAPGPLHGVANAHPSIEGGRIVINTENHRLWRFDNQSQTVEPLTVFGERFVDGSVDIDQLTLLRARSLWLIYKRPRDPQGEAFSGRVLAGGPGGAPVFQPLPRKVEAMVGGVEIFLPAQEAPAPLRSMLLVGATGNGLVRLDVPRWEAQLAAGARPFATLIRRAFTVQGAGADKELPILREPLEYVRNTAHFEVAAGTLAFGANPTFQTRLANFGTGEWSEWSARPGVDYLNLPEGRYVFEARARDSDGRLGSVAALPFRVLPPWQRSPWAYGLYALAAVAGMWGLVAWRSRQLMFRNAELETLVEARTSELSGRQIELVRARDDAESANRAKSAFLANMSHELRTPLNAVLGYTQLLLKQTDFSLRSREQLTVIGQSGGHLLSLINEVLDLSKVEAGKLTLSPFDFSLAQLLDEVSAAFRHRLAEKQLSYTETRGPGLPKMVRTDPRRLRQVLFNLLGNAVKFTERGGVTLVVQMVGGGRIRFEVADTGVGIATDEQQEIFRAFHQVGESTLAAQGTGLGLAISQRLAELLGGRIEVASTLGEGSRFWFELPLSEVAVPGTVPRLEPDAALGKIIGYKGEIRRLLLVDDLLENRRVLRDFLQPLGFEITEAADGATCLAMCAAQWPDAVLLDLRLGPMHGYKVARTLRERAAGAKLGIIAISASVFESDRQQAIDAGCDDFLPKPFEEGQLLGTLGRVLDLDWVKETPTASAKSAESDTLGDIHGALSPSEVEQLREHSLRGDVAAIRRQLDGLLANDASDRKGEVVRRLDALAATYDLESLEELLIKIQSND